LPIVFEGFDPAYLADLLVKFFLVNFAWRAILSMAFPLIDD
jgi:hypothetical protein